MGCWHTKGLEATGAVRRLGRPVEVRWRSHQSARIPNSRAKLTIHLCTKDSEDHSFSLPFALPPVMGVQTTGAGSVREVECARTQISDIRNFQVKNRFTLDHGIWLVVEGGCHFPTLS